MISVTVPVVPGNDDWMPHPDLHEGAGLGHPDFVDHLPFVRFDADGVITATGAMAKAHIMRERLMAGGIMIGVGHWDTHYVDVAGGVPVIRELVDCPAVLEGLVLRTLPVPCAIEISTAVEAPVRYAWSEPSLRFSFDLPGAYTVRVLAPSCRPGSFTVSTETGEPPPDASGADDPPALRHVSDYRARRAAEFPAVGEALDAIRKGFGILAAASFPLPPDTLAWLEASAAVKARLPKPPA